MCIDVSLSRMSMHYVHAVPTGARRCWITLELELLNVVYFHKGGDAGIEPKFSIKRASTLNCRAISPSPTPAALSKNGSRTFSEVECPLSKHLLCPRHGAGL